MQVMAPMLLAIGAVFLMAQRSLGPYRVGAWIVLAGALVQFMGPGLGETMSPPAHGWLVRAGVALPYLGLGIMLGRSRDDRYPLVALLALASIPWHFLPPAAEHRGTWGWIGTTILAAALALFRLAHRMREQAPPDPPQQ